MRNRSGVLHVLLNASWIVSESAIRMGIGFVLAVWIARRYGPDGFGILSFGLAWTAIFGAIGRLGIDGIIVRELVTEKQNARHVLGSALLLRVLSALIVSASSIMIFLAIFGWGHRDQLVVVAILSVAELFRAVEVFEFWFRSRLEWRRISLIRISACLCAALATIFLLVTNTGIIGITVVYLLEAALSAALLLWAWGRHPGRVHDLSVRFGSLRQLLRDCWPNLLSALAIMIYMRIDQIMIGALLSADEVGIYSAAVKISGIWYVIPMAICQSLLPRLVQLRESQLSRYQTTIVRLSAALFWGSVCGSILLVIVAPVLVDTLLGAAYNKSLHILQIHIWTGIFVSLGVVADHWHLVENKLRLTMLRTVAGALTNILLNALLIPRYGGMGAAIATIISYAVSAYLSLSIIKGSHPIWLLINHGIFSPWKRFR